MRKIMLLCVGLLCLGLPLQAAEIDAQNTETEQEPSRNYSGLGVSAGAISGVGFSYRQFFGDHYGVKTSAVIYVDDQRSFFDLGLQGLWVLSENDWLRFYVMGGLADFAVGSTNFRPVAEPVLTDSENAVPAVEKPLPEDLEYEEFRENNNYVNLGAGIGLEIGRKEHGLSLALELPLVFSFKNFSKLEYIYPIPQISLIYNF